MPPQQRQQQRRPQGGGVPGLPKDFKMFALQEAKGLNTKDSRPSIDDQELSWLENFIRIGNGNLRTLWDVGGAVYTAPGGKTIIYFFHFNIVNTNYVAVFLSDGTADAVNLSSGNTVTHISTVANTFFVSNGSRPAVQQWGSSGIVITSTAQANGYWAWDNAAGGTLYSPGQFAPAWLSGFTTTSFTGNTHTSTTVDTLVPGTGTLVVGMGWTGTDIPANTTIASIASGTSITISQAATGTHAGNFQAQWYMPTGISGDSIEVFQSHVFIYNSSNGTGTFSAPSNGASFSAAQGGGTYSSTDGFLKAGFHGVRQANGYLYPFGDSSINVISNIQTAGSPATTTFNNNNVDPQVGTPWRDSVQSFGRALIFANPLGVYGLFGSTAEKLSEKLDGVFTNATLPVSGTNVPSAAVSTIFEQKCYLLLITILDPFVGTPRPALACWDGKTFFMASQSKTLTFINTQEVNSQPLAWGTDGTTLFPLFSTSSSSLKKTLQTKLWAGDGFIIYKQALRLYSQCQDNSGQGYTFSATIDTDAASAAFSVTGNATFTWANNSGQAFTWKNNSNQAFTWGTPGNSIRGQDASATGLLLGSTFTSTSMDFSVIALGIGYRNYSSLG